MDIDPVGAISSAFENAPMVAITAALLIGPTLIYVILRMTFSREKSRPTSSGRMLWACPQCSSVNESINDRCYTCRFEPRAEDDVTIIDPQTGRPITPVVKPWTVRTAQAAAPTRPAVAVGPGRTFHSTQPADQRAAAATPVAVPVAAPRPAPVSVGASAPADAGSAEGGVLHRVGVRRPFDPPTR